MTPEPADDFDDYEPCERCGAEWPLEELDIDGWCPDCGEDEDE